MDLGELGWPRRVLAPLAANGITATEQLTALNPRELRGLPGVGAKTVLAIQDLLGRHGLSLAFDPWGPKVCARHGDPGADVALASFFLCSQCRADFSAKAFSDADPQWISAETIEGYCGHCNRQRDDLRVTQWYLCAWCERVVRSIGRGIVAARYVVETWNEQVAPRLPHLILLETDPPQLQPRSKKTIADKVSAADFTAIDESGDAAFGFELKSGKKAVAGGGVGDPMARFQLDTTDCEDILTVVSREAIPVYLLHVQVLGQFVPPTERYVGVGIWWTDMWSMESHFLNVDIRPRETKNAAYYNIRMFRPMPSFAEHVLSSKVERDRERIRREGAPTLYRLGP
jgi:hypothetical protein